MEQNILQPEIKGKLNLQPLNVALLGFGAADEEKFVRAFKISRPNGRNYIAADDKVHSDIILVNYDNSAALQEKNRLLDISPHTPIVAFSRGALSDPVAHHIRGILIAARILNTLDHVTLAPPAEITAPPLQVVTKTISPALVDTSIPQTALADSVAVPVAIVEPQVEGYLVLVVDDSPAIQKSLELNLVVLPQIGAIDFADSGESALEKADAKHYDLIFLDVMMPGIDGYETCTRLRKKPAYKKTPIIMVSGKTSPLDEVQGVLAGCTTYLTKPVKEAEFQKLAIRVLAWLEKQKVP
jgi:two-component system, cell cycle response regulator